MKYVNIRLITIIFLLSNFMIAFQNCAEDIDLSDYQTNLPSNTDDPSDPNDPSDPTDPTPPPDEMIQVFTNPSFTFNNFNYFIYKFTNQTPEQQMEALDAYCKAKLTNNATLVSFETNTAPTTIFRYAYHNYGNQCVLSGTVAQIGTYCLINGSQAFPLTLYKSVSCKP